MICPKCKAEYREGYTICADCAVELVKALGPHDLPEDGVAGEVEIKGKKLTCPVCSGTSFASRTTMLNTRILTFLDLDWLNKSSVNYICTNCGHILWFFNQPDQLSLDSNYETSPVLPNECPNCFAPVTPGDRECANCGHKLN